MKYVGELTFYYLQEEKSLKHKFREQILKQLQQNSSLNNNDYKDGLDDVLDELKVESK